MSGAEWFGWSAGELAAAAVLGIGAVKPRHDIRHAGQQHRWPTIR